MSFTKTDEVVDCVRGLTEGVIDQGRGSSFANARDAAADADAIGRFAAYAGRTPVAV
jgi:hypothetical protein